MRSSRCWSSLSVAASPLRAIHRSGSWADRSSSRTRAASSSAACRRSPTTPRRSAARARRSRRRRAPVPQQITIGQMYVQFQIPAKKIRRRLAGHHGARLHAHGACLESTPDGREGWYPYFVRKGVPSYVVDQAGRGRSGFDQSVHPRRRSADRRAATSKAAAELIPSFGRITDNGAWTAWFGHLVPAGLDHPHRHADSARRPGDPNPNPTRISTSRRCSRSTPSIAHCVARRRDRTGAGGLERTTRWSTTSSWCRTPRSRCRARPARPAIRRSSRPPTPGRRRTSRRSSSGSAAPSSPRTRSRASWAITWRAS